MEEHEKIKEQLGEAEAIYRKIAEYEACDTGEAYRKTAQRISRTEWRGQALMYSQRIAAMLLLPLLIGTSVLGWLYVKQSREIAENVPYYTVKSAPGLVSQISLPDGTQVWLNTGSSLRYPARFSSAERLVELEGEAYFAVEADSRHPFTVAVGKDVRVSAHGTRFNVSSGETEMSVEATLESGSIDVSLGNRSLRLHPNRMATVDLRSRKLVSRSINAWEKTAWKDGRLIFRDAGMEEVAGKLSKKYNVDIEFASADLLRHRFWASFTTESVTQILDYMKLAAPIDWSYSEPRQLDDYSFARRKILIRARKEVDVARQIGR
ncbi:MAG: FecR domain-containing protein [Tannerellaceae bacterium]|jgi:ferric-dicitrate binding protein FerR (iron transport regulator)|nr:FecR domain-containing protein [Tannerellaceae bacterium]